MSYDSWKLASPEDALTAFDMTNEDAPEIVTCDHCDNTFPDGEGNRLGRDYVCTQCYYAHPAVVGGVMAAIKADEWEGK